MARIYPICSSSGGNCTFIGTSGHGILVDAGCSFRLIKNSLDLIETDINQIEAVFVTHEHIDHIKALPQLFKNTKIPVFASEGTINALKSDPARPIPEDARLYNIFSEGYKSADFEITPFHTPHDSAESVGYVAEYAGQRLAVCTDLGKVTAEVEKNLKGCRAVLLEANYDMDMLRKNPRYPEILKRRIASDTGHLSNSAAAELAEKLVRSGTVHLILGHLSRENNFPRTAFSAVCDYLTREGMQQERDFTLNIAPVTTDGKYIAL